MSSYYEIPKRSDELYHYGRLGMKWGKHVFGDNKVRNQRKAQAKVDSMNRTQAAYDKYKLGRKNPQYVKEDRARYGFVKAVGTGMTALSAGTTVGVALAAGPAAAAPFAAHFVGSGLMTRSLFKSAKTYNNPSEVKKEYEKEISKGKKYLNDRGFDVATKKVNKHYKEDYYYNGAYTGSRDYGKIKTKEYSLTPKR